MSKKRKFTKRNVDRKQNAKISQIAKQVKTLTKAAEKKMYDDVLPASGITATGHVTPMLDIPYWDTTQANRLFQREGNSVNVTSMVIDGMVQIDSSSAVLADLNNVIRIILVRMTDANVAAPLVLDILERQDPNSFYKVDGTRRYTKLYDQRWNLSNPTQSCTSSAGYFATTFEPWRKRFIIKVKLPKTGLKVDWKQGALTASNPVTNGIYMIQISDSGSASVVHPKCKFLARTRFLDD